MDNFTRNITVNSSGGNFSIEGITAFSTVFIVTLFLVIALDILTSVAVLKAPSVKLAIRVLLLNLLVANLLSATAMLCFPLSMVALTYGNFGAGSKVFCRIILGGFIIAAVERLFALAAFSAVTLAIVIRGISFITPLRLFFSIAVGWVLACVVSIDVFIPELFIPIYVDNIACFPDVDAVMHAEVKLFLDAIYITFGGILPLLVCLIVPIVALCYISHRRVSDNSDYTKGLAKFGLFLVASNFINLLGQTLPTLVALEAGPFNIYMAFGFGGVSVVPFPILTILFLKQIRKYVHKQLKQCASCCFKRQEKKLIHSSQSTSSNP